MSVLPRARRIRRAAVATLLAATTVFTGAAGATAFDLGWAPGTSEVSSTASRTTVLARAASWVDQAVPYSQTRWWSDHNGSYRQDCSGYVAMAWGLDEDTTYWTGNLADVSYRIPAATMRPGDILLLPGSHTVIFAGWSDADRSSFNLYEQYRPGYAARHVSGASLQSYLDQGYGAYRYDRIAS